MPLNVEQQKIVLERLNQRWPAPRKCPLCAQNGPWAFGSLCELREYHGWIEVRGGPITPLLSVSCASCGGTQLFNAIQLGVVDPKTGQTLAGEGKL